MGERTKQLIIPTGAGWNAIERPGARQAGYLKKLMESRPFLNRINDFSLIAEPAGLKGEHIEAFQTAADNSYAYCKVYLPVGRTVTLNTGFLQHPQISLWWYNPRTDSVCHTYRIHSAETRNTAEFPHDRFGK